MNCIRSTHRSPQGLWSTSEIYPYETLQVLSSSGQTHPVCNKFNLFSGKLERIMFASTILIKVLVCYFDKGVGGIMSEYWMIITVSPFRVEQHNGSRSSYMINLPFILCQETWKGHERKNIGAENSASSSTKGLCFLFAREEHCSSKANYLTAFGPRKIMLIKSCINPADVHIHPSKYTLLIVAFTIFIKW